MDKPQKAMYSKRLGYHIVVNEDQQETDDLEDRGMIYSSGNIIPGPTKEAVNHPSHYGGGDNPYEVIKVIHNWGLDFDCGNAVKYIARAGKKDQSKEIEDLEKAK